jgi:hypothetical protein
MGSNLELLLHWKYVIVAENNSTESDSRYGGSRRIMRLFSPKTANFIKAMNGLSKLIFTKYVLSIRNVLCIQSYITLLSLESDVGVCGLESCFMHRYSWKQSLN